MRHVDVVILGAGTAGLVAAREVKRSGKTFLLADGGTLGTTCARVGCMPSKALLQVAEDFHRRHVLDESGVRGGAGLAVDPRQVLAHVRALRDGFVQGPLEDVEALGEAFVHGHARLREPTVVQIGDEVVQARAVVLATGSRPLVPAAWQALGDRILTSDSVFELERWPARLAVVGLGLIGVELGQALARLGADVCGIERGHQVAGCRDPEVCKVMADLLAAELPVVFGAEAELTATAGGVRVRAGELDREVDAVLACLGRVPNVADLDLPVLGVPLDARGLPAFDPATLQVGNLPVFMAGDLHGRHAVLHEAADDGAIAGHNAARVTDPHCFERRVRLSVAFCQPNVAAVGTPYDDLPAGTLSGTARFENQGRARIQGRNHGIVRIHAAPDDGRLLGAELAAPDGEHLAHLLAWLVQRGTTVTEALRLPFYHPTVTEALRGALRDLARQLPQGRSFDLAVCDARPASGLD